MDSDDGESGGTGTMMALEEGKMGKKETTRATGQFAMYATPVVYPMATEGLLGLVNKINPATYLIETGRAVLVGGPFDLLNGALIVTAASFCLLLLAWTIFHITVPRIIERMGM